LKWNKIIVNLFFILTLYLNATSALDNYEYDENNTSITPITSTNKNYFEKYDVQEELINTKIKNSRINIFLPLTSYIYISKLINGTLLRSSQNTQGWEFMMAVSSTKVDPLTYDFFLRKGAKFQDGTSFNANSVIENFIYFKKSPYVYSDFHKRVKGVEKISDYHIRFHLIKPYGMLYHDLTTINLYSSKYLSKYGWSAGVGADSLANSMAEPGPYGLGPYILIEGFATGQKQTPIIQLKANPFYYEEGLPYIENITVYTELATKEMLQMALEKERLDITPIPFNKKIETVLSPYSRLYIKPSTNVIINSFNLLKPNGKLKDQKIRIALNKALDQTNLLNFLYKKEGVISPTETSANFLAIKPIIKSLHTWNEIYHENNETPEQLKEILNGLHLKVITIDHYMFLWKGIEHQLKQYGVTLEIKSTADESEVIDQLLKNRKIPQEWDILTTGNDDWFSKNPWSSIFMYDLSNDWCSLEKDDYLQNLIQHLFDYDFNSVEFNDQVSKIVHHVHEKAYMLFIPSPNVVLAVNKEVFFEPSSILLMPLWKAKITRFHWSVRGNTPYPDEHKRPMYPLKFDLD